MLLAEVGDKILAPCAHAVFGAIVGLAAGSSVRFRLWAMLAALVVLAGLNYTLVVELREPGFRDAMIAEMGWTHVIARHVWLNAGFAISALVMLAWRRRSFRADRLSKGLCPSCGYARLSLRPCPECGLF